MKNDNNTDGKTPTQYGCTRVAEIVGVGGILNWERNINNVWTSEIM